MYGWASHVLVLLCLCFLRVPRVPCVPWCLRWCTFIFDLLKVALGLSTWGSCALPTLRFKQIQHKSDHIQRVFVCFVNAAPQEAWSNWLTAKLSSFFRSLLGKWIMLRIGSACIVLHADSEFTVENWFRVIFIPGLFSGHTFYFFVLQNDGARRPAGRPGRPSWAGGRASGRLNCYLRYPRVANPGGRGSGRLNLLNSTEIESSRYCMRQPRAARS